VKADSIEVPKELIAQHHDAATARLISLELGDAVWHRLVSAIEVRSESHRLDGIIAATLTPDTQSRWRDEMKKMLAASTNQRLF